MTARPTPPPRFRVLLSRPAFPVGALLCAVIFGWLGVECVLRDEATWKALVFGVLTGVYVTTVVVVLTLRWMVGGGGKAVV